MGRGPRRLVGTLAVLLGLAGCTHPGHVSNSPSSCGDNSLPTIARGSVEANLCTLPNPAQRDGRPVLDLPPTPEYRALTAAQCQCLAVGAGLAARMYDEQSKLLGPRTDRRGAASRADLCRPGTAQPRCRFGPRTVLPSGRGRGESGSARPGRGRVKFRHARDPRHDRPKAKTPGSLDIWTRQLLSMQSDQTQAEMTVNQLNVQLRQLLGLSDADNWRIWNPELYDVTESEVDVEAAVAEGLAPGRNCNFCAC